jgi:nucleoside-diphosphate-sugar epimerase
MSASSPGPLEPVSRSDSSMIDVDDPILVTGATGFIGTRLVNRLLEHGFRNVRCLARPASDLSRLHGVARRFADESRLTVIHGNLLSPEDCAVAARDVAVVYHLAAARNERSFPDAFLNSVVTTRNLLEACRDHAALSRFVNVSSFSVYTNTGNRQRRLLDESCPIEGNAAARGDAYCFAKVKQDELVVDYGRRFGIPYVIVRPGYVYGPGNDGIPGRVGLGTFGIFLHLGGPNTIPFTYVENCVDAILLAGLKRGVDSEVFNVVDDDPISSRRFLTLYKRYVRRFTSIYVPHVISYVLCFAWEKYSTWSDGQLPPAYNRRMWHAYWKKTHYTNRKLKTRLGWAQTWSTGEALRRSFEAARKDRHLA